MLNPCLPACPQPAATPRSSEGGTKPPRTTTSGQGPVRLLQRLHKAGFTFGGGEGSRNNSPPACVGVRSRRENAGPEKLGFPVTPKPPPTTQRARVGSESPPASSAGIWSRSCQQQPRGTGACEDAQVSSCPSASRPRQRPAGRRQPESSSYLGTVHCPPRVLPPTVTSSFQGPARAPLPQSSILWRCRHRRLLRSVPRASLPAGCPLPSPVLGVR